MSPRKITLALCLAFVVPSILLVALQQDSTNQKPPTHLILYGYFAGTGPLEVVGSPEAVSITQARCLLREIFETCEWLGGEGLGFYNSIVQLLSVWASFCLIYLTAARLMPPLRACAAVLLAAVFIPWGFLEVGYNVSWPYDFPAMFFAALGLWAIVTRRFVVFVVTIVLGTLNKETIVFLLPAYVLAEWPLLPRKTLLGRALLLGVLFVVAYETPRMILAGNHLPTATFSAVEWEIPRWQINLRHLILQKHGSAFENIYLALSLHLLPVLRLRTLPWPLRAAYLAAPVLLIPIFFCGNIYELRLYNELIPLGAIGTILVFARMFETPTAPAPVPVPTVP